MLDRNLVLRIGKLGAVPWYGFRNKYASLHGLTTTFPLYFSNYASYRVKQCGVV